MANIDCVTLKKYEMEVCANNNTEIKAKLEALADWLCTAPPKGAGSNPWSVQQKWSHSSGNDNLTVLTDGTNRMAIGTSSSRDMNSANCYLTTARGNDDLMIAFFAGDDWGTITDVNNPWDDATFCSDDDCTTFRMIEVKPTVTVFYSHIGCLRAVMGAGFVQLIIMSANIGGSYSTQEQCPYPYVLLFCDDAYEDLAITDDDSTWFAQYLPIGELVYNEDITDLLANSAVAEDAPSSWFAVNGSAGDDGYYEDGRLDATLGTLTNDAMDFDNGVEYFRVVMHNSASVGGGVKGTLKRELMRCVCDTDGFWYPNEGHMQHFWRGVCLPLQHDGQALY